ncbi:MAG: flagellar hook-length control protein FliK [Zoogloeaceae bacterium]|nr:flagellar hook-length control protein FliK [Zoogloeaceae bacterium]
MIPADLVARLRLLTEASFFQADRPVGELRPIRPIQADLPEFSAGQRISATIEQPLPNGLFRAIVAGKAVTLALAANTQPDALKPGRSLTLEVTQTDRQAIHARIVGSDDLQPGPPPRLSQAAQLISTLMTGNRTETPALLAAGRPLLQRPPDSAAPLATALQKALTQSGLFYESHQERWIEGSLALSDLRSEPQGHVQPRSMDGTLPKKPQRPVLESAASPAGLTAQIPGTDEAIEAPTLLPEPHGLEPLGERSSGHPIPERLIPLVSQQLDALASHHFAWQGQAWPGQALEWVIEDPNPDGSSDQASCSTWRTSLRLTLPNLGTIEARIGLLGDQIQIAILAEDPTTRATLEGARTSLVDQFSQAGLTLLGVEVDRGRR